MKLGIVIGTFAAVPYVHLQLEAARRLYPDVRVLVHDDASSRGPEIEALCMRYGAEFATNSERQVHHLGDLSVYPAGLVWAKRNGIELVLKVSRRWIWREDWRTSLLARAAESDGTTFSNYTRSYAFGFRTECVAFDVKAWACPEFMAAVAERLAAQEPCFVENYVHQWAVKFSERGSLKWKEWEASNPVPQERSGYAPWDFMGTCRQERIAVRLWHDCDGPQDYAALAAQWGLSYSDADFADPNMGEGIGQAKRDLSMAGAGLPPLLVGLGESLIGAEVGVWRGATSRHLLRCPNVKKLYGIDPFAAYDDWWAPISQDALDAHRAEVMRGLDGHPRFALLQTTSDEAVKQLCSLDFVFIDGNHAAEQVRRDLDNYWLKLRAGGLFSGHDYRTLPAVKEAVDAFAERVKATISETDNDVWYCYKPQATMPRVAVFTVAHNEAVMLPFFARHYAWAEKVVIFDDESTDGTREALSGFPNVEIRYVNGGGVLDNGFLLRIKNNCWKECRGKGFDWVIVVDADEFVWSKDISESLRVASTEGATLLRPARGFSMVGERVPDTNTSLPETIRRGVASPGYCKPCIFVPDRIAEINFSPGCHDAAPAGEVQAKVDETLTMLHYVFLSADFHVERGKIRRDRRSPADIARGWGCHHAQSDDQNRVEHAHALRDAVWVIGEPEPGGSILSPATSLNIS